MFDIAFVSNTQRNDRPFYDPSTRYRAFAPAEYFRSKGLRTTCVSQKVFEENAGSFASVPVISFHRPSATEKMLRFVSRQRKKQTLIADYDDLVFDVAQSAQTPAVRDRGENPTQIARGIAAKAEIGEMFEYKTASTLPLAEAADRILGGETVVVHNALDSTYRSVAAEVSAQDAQGSLYDLGYFSGTASHNRDLKMIAPQIAEFLAQSAAHTLLLVGPVEIPAALRLHEHQITQRAVDGYYDMTLAIRTCKMVLGPLEDTPFTRCKSGLKFFEAAILGTRVAATPIPDIDRFDSPLLHKCATPESWLAAFNSPSIDPDSARKAQQDVDLKASLGPQMATWEAAFL